MFCNGRTYPSALRFLAVSAAALICPSLNPARTALSVITKADSFVAASNFVLKVFESVASSSFNFFSSVFCASLRLAPAWTNSS